MSPKHRNSDTPPAQVVPGTGNIDYAFSRYELALDYEIGGNRLDGHAVIQGHSLATVDRLVLDLVGLTTRTVRVNGSKPRRFSQHGGQLSIDLSTPLPAGGSFSLELDYGGHPAPRDTVWSDIGWEELQDGVLVSGQPNGAPTWFPCDDAPGQKACFRISVTTNAGYRVVSNGRLLGKTRNASRETWIFEQTDPMAPYLATLQIGRYGLHRIRQQLGPLSGGSIGLDDTPAQFVAVSQALRNAADSALELLPRMMKAFIQAFGPYPFLDHTVVVTDDELEIPLEAQGVSVIGSNHLARSWKAQRLIAHELSHQWFGNSLTVGHWSEIWMHEGFACYAEWIWSEAIGLKSADKRARKAWSSLSNLPQDLRVGDPGPEDMFDDRIYLRGALALHALRLKLGDETFFAMLRDWTARHRHGTIGYQLFKTHVENHAPGGFSTEAFLRPWLFRRSLPLFPSPG